MVKNGQNHRHRIVAIKKYIGIASLSKIDHRWSLDLIQPVAHFALPCDLWPNECRVQKEFPLWLLQSHPPLYLVYFSTSEKVALVRLPIFTLFGKDQKKKSLVMASTLTSLTLLTLISSSPINYTLYFLSVTPYYLCGSWEKIFIFDNVWKLLCSYFFKQPLLAP